MEDTVVEWFDYTCVSNESLLKHLRRYLDFHAFSSQFKFHSIEVGGIDFSVWRLHLEALKIDLAKEKTSFSQFYSDLNQVITTVQRGCLNTEVKRTGFLIDRGNSIEVRPGDTLIVYVSMGGFDKIGGFTDKYKE